MISKIMENNNSDVSHGVILKESKSIFAPFNFLKELKKENFYISFVYFKSILFKVKNIRTFFFKFVSFFSF